MKQAWQSMASETRSTIARRTRSRSSVEETVLMIRNRCRVSVGRADVFGTDIAKILHGWTPPHRPRRHAVGRWTGEAPRGGPLRHGGSSVRGRRGVWAAEAARPGDVADLP